MKKILFAAFAVVAASFASCGNETKSSNGADSLSVDSVDTVVVDSVSVDSVA